MAGKSIATIQSLSGFGKSSLSVALPILSAAGHETSILPSVVLSAHTGYENPVKSSLGGFLENSLESWVENGIRFDALYTGYLCTENQIESIIKVKDNLLRCKGIFFCDPAMGDGGKLYSGFKSDFPKAMLKLCASSDVILPNLTEACLMTGIEYKTEYQRDYIEEVINSIKKITRNTIVLTGVSFDDDNIYTVISEDNKLTYIATEKQYGTFHGTGDVFASCIVSAVMNGMGIADAARFAGDFVSEVIKYTVLKVKDEKSGLAFEEHLNLLF